MNHEEFNRIVGARLRAVRKKRNETMNIAHRVRDRHGVKIDPSHLSRLERGVVAIPLRTLFALAQYYDVSMDALTGGSFTSETSARAVGIAERIVMPIAERLGLDVAEKMLTAWRDGNLALIEKLEKKENKHEN